MRNPVAVCVFALAVAACGSASGEVGGEPTPTTTTNATEADGLGATSKEQNTTTTEVAEDDGVGSPTESTGTVTIGNTEYFFAIDADGTCDPDFYGSFRAFMSQIDSSGGPLVGQMTISASAEGEGLIGGELEGVLWSAGNPDGGSIDSVEIDGNRMRGTATFVSPDTGETQEGRFEVTCAGE